MDKLTKYRTKVYRVLTEQNFIIGDREKKTIKEQTSNGRRYFFMTAQRIEGDKPIERFIKIPENNTKILLLPFKRQIEITKYIQDHNVINTRGIIASNYNPKHGTPFVIMETLPTKNVKIGFIQQNKGAERLTEYEATKVIAQLYQFHSISVVSLPKPLRKILKSYPNDYATFTRKVYNALNKKVTSLDTKGKPEPFYRVLERRLKIANIKNRVKELLIQYKPTIDSKVNHITSIVHGDMSPNNLYIFNSGEVELLDLEWVGISKNSVIAMILDFGNLRARSWINESFRDALDRELVRIYKKNGEEEIGKIIVQLSIIYSHIKLSGFFENYDHQKQKKLEETRRRKSTEKDIAKIFK